MVIIWSPENPWFSGVSYHQVDGEETVGVSGIIEICATISSDGYWFVFSPGEIT